MTATIIQNHAVLLKDKVRMSAYKKAIAQAVKPGDTVLDLGCGLGILSFYALRAGASRVHAVEMEPYTMSLARLVAEKNGLLDKITFHNKISTSLKLKTKADVVVSELFGNLGLNENLLTVLIDARERLLKNGGIIVPCGASVSVAPCEHKDWAFTASFLHNVDGLDVLPDSDEVDLGTPSVIIRNEELLAAPARFAEVNFENAVSDRVDALMTFEIVRDAVLTGFAGWFEARLTDKVKFATNPSNLTTHWKQGFLPLRLPQKVREGQKVTLEMEMSPDPARLHSVIGYRYEIGR